MLSHVTRIFATVFFLSVVAPAEATLLSRLGGAAAYDDVLKITWVTDAALSGPNNWDNQVAWASGLNYLGFDDWRLASMSVSAGLPTGTTSSVVDCRTDTELACRDNELGYMYFQYLGGSSFLDLTGNQTVNAVNLTNIQSYYWSGTEYNSNHAWYYNYKNSGRFDIPKYNNDYGWAVRSGDVAAVPEPPMVWLLVIGMMGLGLLGVAGRQRRR